MLQIDSPVSYKLNPFTVFFVGSSHGLVDDVIPDDPGFRQTDRIFFVKCQYLLRV